MKKLLSVVRALLMLAVMLPVTAMAAEVEVSTYEQMKTALATPGAYVKLTTDIDTTQITLTKKPDVVEAADNCTIDLNGFTFKASNFTVVFEGNNLTIKNGKFDSNGGSYALFVGDEGGSKNVVIEDIETTGGINFYNASATLRNVTSAGTNYYSVWCDEGSFVTIESGEYSSNGPAVLGMALLETPAVKVDLTVNGGKFYVSGEQSLVLPSTAEKAHGTPSITGGTFYATPEQMEKIKEYIPTNSELTQTGDGFTVVPKAPTQIVIITPAGDTPKTDDQKNPTTGANDMVAAAAALMAVSVLGMAVLSRKK